MQGNSTNSAPEVWVTSAVLPSRCTRSQPTQHSRKPRWASVLQLAYYTMSALLKAILFLALPIWPELISTGHSRLSSRTPSSRKPSWVPPHAAALGQSLCEQPAFHRCLLWPTRVPWQPGSRLNRLSCSSTRQDAWPLWYMWPELSLPSKNSEHGLDVYLGKRGISGDLV